MELIDCCTSLLLRWMQSHCCWGWKEIFGHKKLKKIKSIYACSSLTGEKNPMKSLCLLNILEKYSHQYDVCKTIMWKICHEYSSCYAQRSCLQFINETSGCLFMINGHCHIHKNVSPFHLNLTILSHLDLTIVTKQKRHQRGLKRDASNTDAMKQSPKNPETYLNVSHKCPKLFFQLLTIAKCIYRRQHSFRGKKAQTKRFLSYEHVLPRQISHISMR